jgi:hypothetical protein
MAHLLLASNRSAWVRCTCMTFRSSTSFIFAFAISSVSSVSVSSVSAPSATTYLSSPTSMALLPASNRCAWVWCACVTFWSSNSSRQCLWMPWGVRTINPHSWHLHPSVYGRAMNGIWSTMGGGYWNPTNLAWLGTMPGISWMSLAIFCRVSDGMMLAYMGRHSPG